MSDNPKWAVAMPKVCHIWYLLGTIDSEWTSLTHSFPEIELIDRLTG
jgi:hypothetical protein